MIGITNLLTTHKAEYILTFSHKAVNFIKIDFFLQHFSIENSIFKYIKKYIDLNKIGTVEFYSPVPIFQYAVFTLILFDAYDPILSTMKQQYPTDTDYFPQSLPYQLQCPSQERYQPSCPLGTRHSMRLP